MLECHNPEITQRRALASRQCQLHTLWSVSNRVGHHAYVDDTRKYTNGLTRQIQSCSVPSALPALPALRCPALFFAARRSDRFRRRGAVSVSERPSSDGGLGPAGPKRVWWWWWSSCCCCRCWKWRDCFSPRNETGKRTAEDARRSVCLCCSSWPGAPMGSTNRRTRATALAGFAGFWWGGEGKHGRWSVIECLLSLK